MKYIRILFFSILLFYSSYIYADSNFVHAKLADKLYKPWGIAVLDDDNLLVTQKSGELFKINIRSKAKTEIDHNLIVSEYGQGGLLDILYYNEKVYVSYAEKRDDEKYSTSVAIGELKGSSINFNNIFQSEPPNKSKTHFGSRLEIKNDHLFVTIGERQTGNLTQELDNHFGKIIRLNLDGSVPVDNPYIDIENGLDEIYMIGLRNPQGMARSPIDNELYITNHGPKGGDFFGKVIEKGNYGWDDVAWGGTDYDGTIIGDGSAWLPGLVKPIYRWIPSIAVSDIFFYEGEEFKEWQGDVLLSSLKFQQLLKLDYENGKVRDVSIIFEKKGRLRDVEVNNRGEVFYIIDDSKGSLWQLQKS